MNARPPHVQATINRAIARAHDQARAGNLPALLSSDVRPEATRQTWAITSRSLAGAVYLVDLVADCTGVDTHCQCEASHAGRICWHRAAVRLALFGDIGHHDCRGWHDAGTEDLADLLTQWTAKQSLPRSGAGMACDPFDAADWVAA
jgi:hypothetical protein